GQTVAQALADVRGALSVQPPHLSLYELTIEAHTAFAHNPPPLPAEDERLAIEDAVTEAACTAGYERYEISAYARPGHRCVHNLNYWRFGDYLGLGSGAHSKLTGPAGVSRPVRIADPARYMADEGRVATCRRLSEGDVLFEFLLNALRLTEGFSEELLRARTGHDFASLDRLWAQAVEQGLLQREQDRMRTTPLGRRFLDSLLTDFLTNADTVSAKAS
ncbi:MAG: radical SAM family heme chaperone HemW, partial [Acidiferrobacter sp.]